MKNIFKKSIKILGVITSTKCFITAVASLSLAIGIAATL